MGELGFEPTKQHVINTSQLGKNFIVQSTEDIGIRQTFEQKTMRRRNEMLRDMDLFSTYFSSSFLEPCPKLVLSDHSATNTQLAYDFLLHRRKLMMSIYHELRALYNFHSTSRVFPLQTIAGFKPTIRLCLGQSEG